jgi:hypothetical protein
LGGAARVKSFLRKGEIACGKRIKRMPRIGTNPVRGCLFQTVCAARGTARNVSLRLGTVLRTNGKVLQNEIRRHWDAEPSRCLTEKNLRGTRDGGCVPDFLFSPGSFYPTVRTCRPRSRGMRRSALGIIYFSSFLHSFISEASSFRQPPVAGWLPDRLHKLS